MWERFIEKDGIVEPQQSHFWGWLVMLMIGFTIGQIIGFSGLVMAALLAWPLSYFTHKADKEINGGEEA